MQALDINDAGQIVGYGSNNSTGQRHAVLLDPVRTQTGGNVPEPGSLALLGLALAGLGVGRRKAA